MSIRDIINNWKEKREINNQQFKEMEREFLLRKKLEDRQKSSNERELEKFMKEKREEDIKRQLNEFRNKQRNEMWRGNSILKQKSILKNERPILKEKNIFHLKGNMLDNDIGVWKW